MRSLTGSPEILVRKGADLGLEKGHSPVTEEIVDAVTCHIRGLAMYLWNAKDQDRLLECSEIEKQ